jgi:hypothetical protein
MLLGIAKGTQQGAHSKTARLLLTARTCLQHGLLHGQAPAHRIKGIMEGDSEGVTLSRHLIATVPAAQHSIARHSVQKGSTQAQKHRRRLVMPTTSACQQRSYTRTFLNNLASRACQLPAVAYE